jgi:hypothetical protein
MSDAICSPPPQFQLYKDKDKSILHLATTFTAKDFPLQDSENKSQIVGGS